MSERKTRKLRIFRLVDGVRVPFLLELDSELTVVSEEPDKDAYDRVVYGRAEENSSNLMSQWATPEMDNPIPGTDELRAKYITERENLIQHYAEMGLTCKPCEIGRLIIRYRLLLENAGYLRA